MIELEVGGEYGYWLGTTARLFARAGLVGQAWFNAGNASNAGLNGTADDNATLGFTGYRLPRWALIIEDSKTASAPRGPVRSPVPVLADLQVALGVDHERLA